MLLIHAYEAATLAALRRQALIGGRGQLGRIRELVRVFHGASDTDFIKQREVAIWRACLEGLLFLRRSDHIPVGLPAALTLEGIEDEMAVLSRFVRFGKVGRGLPPIHHPVGRGEGFTPLPDTYEADMDGFNVLEDMGALETGLGDNLPGVRPTAIDYPPMPDEGLLGVSLEGGTVSPRLGISRQLQWLTYCSDTSIGCGLS
jgi:hypothetical protein